MYTCVVNNKIGYSYSLGKEVFPVMIQFPYDTNLRYLPLVYLLPPDLILQCPTLRTLPRCLSEIAASNEMMDLITGDAFLKEIMDAAASLAFPHFGFGGWKEHYTGYSPVWRLSYSLPVWAKRIEQETGWGLQALFRMKPGTQIPFPDDERVQALFGKVVKRAIEEQGWQPILDVVREMPCDEDFEPWQTNVRIDFLRKWYHTRSKKVQTVSLEELIEADEDGSIFYIPDATQNVEAYVIAKDFVERFLAMLSEKDRQIVLLRQDGYSYMEIADRMGYKNHSGVIKRIEAVKKKLKEYQNKA